jgi:hypothetical protein
MTLMGKSRAGDQAHMAASGRRRPSCQSGAAPDYEILEKFSLIFLHVSREPGGKGDN